MTGVTPQQPQMEPPTPSPIEPSPVPPTEEMTQLAAKINNGAGWFTWIAVLSLINVIVMMSGGDFILVIGLGVPLALAAFATEISSPAGKVILLAIAIIFCGLFLLFGMLAKRRKMGAFITGFILYFLDTLIFLLGPDYLGLGFHLFAMYFIFGGMRACKELNIMERLLQQQTPAFNPANVPPPINYTSSPPPSAAEAPPTEEENTPSPRLE